MAKKTVYDIITERIVERLEQGVIPWRKPWINSDARNWFTERPYNGINSLLLDPGEYATKLQIKKSGGRIKREEMKKSSIVVFWNWKEEEDEETGEKTSSCYPIYYKVWEINRQCEGLTSKRTEIEFIHNPIEEAEKIIKGYMNSPTYTFNPGRATYTPFFDVVNVPPMKDFPKVEEYYCTFFHEIVHSTGHKSRLNRKGIESVAPFGSEDYSKEELIAEVGASMLCGMAGIENTLDNSASYIQSWIRVLKGDSRLVAVAAQQAQKAVNYIVGKTEEVKERVGA